MKTNLIIDANNLIYRTFYVNLKESKEPDILIPYCIQSTFNTMNRYYKMFSADDVIMAFDSYSWRKLYTKDTSKCVTNKKYKNHRRDDKTESQLELLKILDEHLEDFYNLIKNNTSILTLKENLLEADDLIAGYVQMHGDCKNVIVSGDGDFLQLLGYKNTVLFNPNTDKEADLKAWENDHELFLFEKCIRGESKKKDNVQSSYPRLRKTKLIKAFHDPYERENIMNHTFKQLELNDETGEYEEVEYNTRELFKENKLLMDLRCQPKIIKKKMVKTILRSKQERGKYNHIKFLKFCSRNELDALIQSVDSIVPMLRTG